MKKLFRTDVLFALSGILFLILGFIYLSLLKDSTLDINVHDTYFVTSYTHVFTYLSIPFFLFALVYFLFVLFKRPLGKILGFLHFVLSILFLFTVFFSNSVFLSGVPRRYYTNSHAVFYDSLVDLNQFIFIVSIAFVIAQLLLLINIIWTLVRPREKNSN